MTSLRADSGWTKVGWLSYSAEQTLGVGRKPEEVVGLADVLDRSAVDAAVLDAVLDVQVGRQFELLAADAVEPFVEAFVDLARLVQPAPELLDPLDVVGVGRANELVVRRVDRLEHRPPCRLDELVGPRLRAHAVFFGCAKDLLAVLVGAGEIPDALTALPVPPGENVAHDRRVGTPDRRSGGDVVDRRCDVVRLLLRRPRPAAAVSGDGWFSAMAPILGTCPGRSANISTSTRERPRAQRESRARAESLASVTVIGRPAFCRPIAGMFW